MMKSEKFEGDKNCSKSAAQIETMQRTSGLLGRYWATLTQLILLPIVDLRPFFYFSFPQATAQTLGINFAYILSFNLSN